MKNDKKFMVQASRFAKKAVDYILNIKPTESSSGFKLQELVEEPEIL